MDLRSMRKQTICLCTSVVDTLTCTCYQTLLIFHLFCNARASAQHGNCKVKQICLQAAVGNYISSRTSRSFQGKAPKTALRIHMHSCIYSMPWMEQDWFHSSYFSDSPKKQNKTKQMSVKTQIPIGNSHQILSFPPIHPAASLAPSLEGLTAGNREPSCMQPLQKHFEYLRSAKYLVKV